MERGIETQQINYKYYENYDFEIEVVQKCNTQHQHLKVVGLQPSYIQTLITYQDFGFSETLKKTNKKKLTTADFTATTMREMEGSWFLQAVKDIQA